MLVEFNDRLTFLNTIFLTFNTNNLTLGETMSLKETITNDMKSAMKAGEKEKLSAIRMLLSSLKYKEKELKREPNDEEIVQAISTMIKQRKESIEQYTKGGRQELADSEAKEVEVLMAYMPEQLGEDEVRQIIKDTASEIGATEMKDMGNLMKASMDKLKGKADGKVVNAIVKEVLS